MNRANPERVGKENRRGCVAMAETEGHRTSCYGCQQLLFGLVATYALGARARYWSVSAAWHDTSSNFEDS